MQTNRGIAQLILGLALGCGGNPEPATTANQEALFGGTSDAIQGFSASYAETWAFRQRFPDAMISSAIRFTGTPGSAFRDGTHFNWGCSSDSNMAVWSIFDATPVPAAFQSIGDFTGFGRNTSGSGFQAYFISIGPNNQSLNLYRIANACAGGSVSLTSFGGFTTVDYPTGVIRTSDDTRWVTFSAVSGGIQRIVVGKINDNLSFPVWVLNAEPNAADFARPAFDSAGVMHIAYFAASTTTNSIRHATFDPSTLQFGAPTTVAPSVGPPFNLVSCNCSVPCYPTVSPAGLATTSGLPTIAIDRQTDTAIVAVDSAGSGISCGQRGEMTVYRSTNGGASWAATMVTGCQNTVQPAAIWTGFNKFRIQTSYNNGSGSLAQVVWDSTDGGVTWTGAFLPGGARNLQKSLTTSSCYWGDYHQPATGAFGHFFNWSDPPNTANGTPWNSRGVADVL
jgi:hypothetical protein